MKQLSLQFAFQLILFPSPQISLQTLLVAKVFILWPVICNSNDQFKDWFYTPQSNHPGFRDTAYSFVFFQREFSRSR